MSAAEIDYIAEARKVVGPGPDVSNALAGTPREVPGSVRTGALVGLGVGMAALVLGLLTAKERTLGVLLVCIVYFMAVSQGGVMFAAVQTITLGRWGRPFKRVAESFGFFLPIVWSIWILFLVFGGIEIYPWLHEEMPPHKAVWLTKWFFIGRQVVLLGFLMLLDFIFIRNSLRADLGAAAEVLGARAPSWWGSFTAGWQGTKAEAEATYQKNIRLAPAIVVTYAIVFSLFAVDAVMSLAPHWYANMFPAWTFVSSFWLAINWICIISVFGRKWLQVDHLMAPKNYHDLGKLMFALSVFWTYTMFAHVLPIWYGNMPEETGYLILRMYLDPWAPLAKVVGIGCFLFPFSVLLSRGIKKTPDALVWIAMLIVTAVWLERFLLVMPEVWHKDTLPLGLVEVGVFVGFISAFVLVVTKVLSQVPPVPFTDPFMNPHPADVHVHPEHDHGHAHA